MGKSRGDYGISRGLLDREFGWVLLVESDSQLSEHGGDSQTSWLCYRDVGVGHNVPHEARANGSVDQTKPAIILIKHHSDRNILCSASL